MTLKSKLSELKLTTCVDRLEQVLTESADKNLSVQDTIQWLLELEIEARRTRSIQRRFRMSRLRTQPTIDEFRFQHHKSRSRIKSKIHRLLELEFIRQGANIIIIGNPGTGKTFLSKIIAWKACVNNFRVLFTPAMDMLNQLLAAQVDHSLVKKLKTYVDPALLVIDELGYLTLDQETSNLLYQVISARYSFNRSTIITTNTPFAEWGNILNNTTIAAAIADRLVEESEVFLLGGDSFRKAKKSRSAPSDDSAA